MGIGRFLFAGQAGIEYIIIPVEQGFACILQTEEEFCLYLVQNVEAYKDIAFIMQFVGSQLLHDIAVHHALVGYAESGEILAVMAVDIS